MRGRFSQFFARRSHSTFSNIAGVTALGGAATLAYGFTHRRQNSDRVNVKLDTFQKMHTFTLSLEEAFAAANPDNQSTCDDFNALLIAIAKNDMDNATLMINSLADADTVITSDILDDLIAFTTNHNKIEALVMLQEVFGAEVVLRNHHAKKLLAYSPEEQKKLSYYCEQFYQSPGEISFDGMEMFVDVMEDEILQRHLEHRSYQPTYLAYDLDHDIAEGYRQVRSEQEIIRELEQRFAQTLVVDQCMDFESSKSEMKSFMMDLRASAIQSKQPVTGTMLLASGHYMFAQIEVVHNAKTGETNATMVFVDPLGAYANLQRTYLNPYISVPHGVFSNTELFYSEEKLQFAPLGCSLFVCDLFTIAHDLTQILEKNYPDENIHSLFDYARRYQTSTHDYAVSEDLNDETFNSVEKFHLFPLPPAMILSKQSLTNSGFHKDGDKPDLAHYEEQVFKQTAEGKFTADIVQKDPQKRLGVMGLDEAKIKSPRKRQNEFNGPADVSGNVTVKEAIDENIVTIESNGSHVRRNKRADYLAYRHGVFFSTKSDRVLEYAKERELEAEHEKESLTLNAMKKHH